MLLTFLTYIKIMFRIIIILAVAFVLHSYYMDGFKKPSLPMLKNEVIYLQRVSKPTVTYVQTQWDYVKETWFDKKYAQLKNTVDKDMNLKKIKQDRFNSVLQNTNN